MRVLVCGGRDYNNRDRIALALKDYRAPKVTDVSEHVIIVGGATGADTLAEEWADVWGVRKRVFMADWKKHGKAAGPIRNQKMLEDGKPDIVLAFGGGRGTADMIRRAQAAGIPVVEFDRA
ncbi:DUF2493 domain-containing protein [Rhizobium sp.]|uniref:DUF2493 domain-containing protein n=1 Tax=Rhizobium sp. TaxID=391 RepID=UPI003F818C98